MGTRSRIAVMHGSKILSVYCHWDGYPSHNGAILEEHYTSMQKANNLVALGDVSSLAPEIGEKHDFSYLEHGRGRQEYEDKYGNMTTFYGRDRGDTDVAYKVSDSFGEFMDLCSSCGAEYYYIIRDGVWYCGDDMNGWNKAMVINERRLDKILEPEALARC